MATNNEINNKIIKTALASKSWGLYINFIDFLEWMWISSIALSCLDFISETKYDSPPTINDEQM